MALASTSVHVVAGAPKNGCRQSLCPQGELKLTPASPGDSPRSAGRFDPGSYQITASALGPRVCEILCVAFRSGVSISPSPLGPPKVSPIGLKTKYSGGLSSRCRTPRLGSLTWTSDLSLLWENLCNLIIL